MTDAATAPAGSEPAAAAAPVVSTKTKFKALFRAAGEAVDDHEKLETHGSMVLLRLVEHAPEDAHLFDVLSHTFRVCLVCGMPPGVAGLPGRNLILKAFEAYKVEKLPTLGLAEKTEEEIKAQKKKAFEEWQDMSELLQKAVTMLMKRLDSAGASQQ